MAHTWSPRRRRLREALGYLRWCYLPWRTTAVTGVYDLLATRALSDHRLYLNLGCWQEARTTDDACQALVHLVAAAAALGPRDRLLDVGFGFAEQDISWMESCHKPRHDRLCWLSQKRAETWSCIRRVKARKPRTFPGGTTSMALEVDRRGLTNRVTTSVTPVCMEADRACQIEPLGHGRIP
jgi:hypothetical protein